MVSRKIDFSISIFAKSDGRVHWYLCLWSHAALTPNSDHLGGACQTASDGIALELTVRNSFLGTPFSRGWSGEMECTTKRDCTSRSPASPHSFPTCRLHRTKDEDDILEYHEIVRLLEEASRQDLSQFRVAPGRVQQEANRTAVGSYSGSWQTRDQKKNLVEYAYFRGQVRGLIAA